VTPTAAAAGPQGAHDGPAVAPSAPGSLGQAAPADLLRGYLLALGQWVDRRREELDRLDQACLRSADPDAYSGDVALSMALWQAVSDRYDAMLPVWDSGRADVADRERLSRLIWGRMDTAGGLGAGLGVTVTEASRLCDALATQLRARLSFDPRASEAAVRVEALRAALERLRELVKVEPGWAPQVATLTTRTDDLAARAARGGDVAGALAALETDAARAERDLIVRTATRGSAARRQEEEAERAARALRDLGADRTRVQAEVAALERREDAARELARRCRRAVTRPPRFAVPDVGSLGPVPQDRAALDAFTARARDVARALDAVERAYAAPLAERDELAGLLDAYRVMASRTRRDPAQEQAVAAAARDALVALRAVPCDLEAARDAVRRYQHLIRPPRPDRPDRTDRPDRPSRTGSQAGTDPAGAAR